MIRIDLEILILVYELWYYYFDVQIVPHLANLSSYKLASVSPF